MKLYSTAVLALGMAGMVGCQVSPLPADNSDILRLRDYAVARHLDWEVTISPDGVFYCSSLAKEFSIIANCSSFIGSSVDGAIGKWDQGFGQKLAEGKSQ